jgi:hypothetical protein
MEVKDIFSVKVHFNHYNGNSLEKMVIEARGPNNIKIEARIPWPVAKLLYVTLKEAAQQAVDEASKSDER